MRLTYALGCSFEGQICDKFYTPSGLVRQSTIAQHPVTYVAVNYHVNSQSNNAHHNSC